MIMTREEALKVAKPILFNTAMVKAIQDDLKTETRRVLKPQPANKNDIIYKHPECGKWFISPDNDNESELEIKPRHKIGDILYVRETWAKNNITPHDPDFVYRADYDCSIKPYCEWEWKPSIHMPKEAARLFLRITDVSIEHLQDITEEQAIREGIARLFDDRPDAEYIDWAKRTGVYPKSKADWGYKNYLWHGNFGMYGEGNKLSDAWEYQCSAYDTAIDSFSSLWNTTVPLKDWNIYGWDANPWVGVFKFERLEVTR